MCGFCLSFGGEWEMEEYGVARASRNGNRDLNQEMRCRAFGGDISDITGSGKLVLVLKIILFEQSRLDGRAKRKRWKSEVEYGRINIRRSERPLIP